MTIDFKFEGIWRSVDNFSELQSWGESNPALWEVLCDPESNDWEKILGYIRSSGEVKRAEFLKQAFPKSPGADWREAARLFSVAQDGLQGVFDEIGADFARWKKESERVDETCNETGVCRSLNLPGGARIEMIYCSPGTFMMGSPLDEEKRDLDETYYQVTLAKGFWLGKYAVTQKQWKSVMGENPSEFKGDKRPVEHVSWTDCQEFIKRVNKELDCGARLPTEAEWEYACRAGTTTVYHFGNSLNGNDANCDGNWPYGTRTKGPYVKETTPVGKYAPNIWGFYDMHGNVREWCDMLADYSNKKSVKNPKVAKDGEPVLRGGCWWDISEYCRSAYRGIFFDECSGSNGFRLCCSLK